MAGIRIYFSDTQTLKVGDRAEIEGEAAHHLLRVLRAKRGDVVTLFDGMGGAACGGLVEVGKRTAKAEILEISLAALEHPLRLGLGALKGKAMDDAVRYATVLNFTDISFLVTDFGDVSLEADRAARRLEGLARVALEACKQCGRLRIPQLQWRNSLEVWLDEPGTGKGQVVASLEAGSIPILSHLERVSGEVPLTVAVGPAGDFSEREYAMLRDRGFEAVRLGEPILRAEMAVAYIGAVVDSWRVRARG